MSCTIIVHTIITLITKKTNMNNNKQNYQTNSKIGSTWTTDENLSSLKKEFLLDRVINNSVTGYISD